MLVLDCDYLRTDSFTLWELSLAAVSMPTRFQ